MINVSVKLARIYAKALIAIGQERDKVTEIYDGLLVLGNLYDSDREFRDFFTSPRIEPAQKKEVMRKALEGRVCPEVFGLVRVLIDKRREAVLDNIADQFARFRDDAEGKAHLFISTARALTGEDLEALRGSISARTGKDIVLHQKVEPGLIGGMVLRMGDRVVDGSLRRRLRALRKNLVAKERLFG